MPVMTGTKRAKATALTSNKTSIYGVVGGLAPRTGRQGGRNIQMWSANNKIVIPRDPGAAFCYMNHNNLLSENPAGSGSINKTLSNTPLHRLGYHRPKLNDCGKIIAPGTNEICNGPLPHGPGTSIPLNAKFSLGLSVAGQVGPGTGLGQNNATHYNYPKIIGWWAWVKATPVYTIQDPLPLPAMEVWRDASNGVVPLPPTWGIFNPPGLVFSYPPFTLYGIYHYPPGNRYILIIKHDTAGVNINDTLTFQTMRINWFNAPSLMANSSVDITEEDIQINQVIGPKLLNTLPTPPGWHDIKDNVKNRPEQGCGFGIFALGIQPFSPATQFWMASIFSHVNGGADLPPGNNPSNNQINITISIT